MRVSIPIHLETYWRAFTASAKIARPLPSIEQAGELRGKRVLLRTSLNTPMQDGRVASDFRLRAALPTIGYLKRAGARVIIIGHIGREPEHSLRAVCEALSVHTPVTFVPDVVGDRARGAIASLSNGDAIMLENLRSDPGEQSNSDRFARDLSALGDVYVNDAFAACHREHASIVGVPAHLPHYAGIRLIEEVETLSGAFRPTAPSLFVLGGAKFETKRPLIEKFLGVYDTLFVGGALANDFFRARGHSIGSSVTSEDVRGIAGLLDNPKLLLPVDVIVSNGKTSRVTTVEEVADDERICDAGPKTTALLEARVNEARYLLWNGPLGNTERGFSAGTDTLARAIARASVQSVGGGGDTVASIEQADLLNAFSFLSTGGGSMLQFLVDETLPGIDALTR